MLEMSEYLLPYNTKLNIEEKRRLFAMKNRMTLIPSNYGNSKEKCPCGTEENMLHIYTCEYLNEDEPKILYDELNNGKLKDQIDIFRRFENNMERRKYPKEIFCENQNKVKNTRSPRDLCDPLNCCQCRFG